jgi:hypothetical protein
MSFLNKKKIENDDSNRQFYRAESVQPHKLWENVHKPRQEDLSPVNA